MECTMRNSHGQVVDGESDALLEFYAKREKVIIDTDPGIGEFRLPVYFT